MHLRFKLLFAAAASSSSARFIYNNTIGSCADVHCPIGNESARAECQVTSRTHLTIGMREISSEITDDNTNLTWTVGTHVYNNIGGNSTVRKIEKDFYLGKPPSLDFAQDDLPYSGCAIFLYGNEKKRSRSGEDDSRSCQDVVGLQCFENIQNDARSIFERLSANASLSPGQICQETKDALNTTFSEGCDLVSGTGYWNQSDAVLLTGSDAPQPPSQAVNQSSDCHPTLPKSNDLTHVFGYNDTGTLYADSTDYMLNSINLVLTTFWSPNSSVEGDMYAPNPQLTCLWPVEWNDRTVETETPSLGGRVAAGEWMMAVSALFAIIWAIG